METEPVNPLREAADSYKAGRGVEVAGIETRGGHRGFALRDETGAGRDWRVVEECGVVSDAVFAQMVDVDSQGLFGRTIDALTAPASVVEVDALIGHIAQDLSRRLDTVVKTLPVAEHGVDGDVVWRPLKDKVVARIVDRLSEVRSEAAEAKLTHIDCVDIGYSF